MSKSTCPCEQIYASATSQSSAITISGDIVTANASATASSAVSYEDALSLATKLSTQLASNDAQHDANVIDQTLTIVNSRSLIPSTAGITIGSKASPYSQVYTAKGLVLSSNSPGNQVILNGSNNKLYANGAEVYTSANPQGSAGESNTFFGTSAGALVTTGILNSGFGAYSQSETTTGNRNVSVGVGSLQFNRNGNYNVAVGFSALGNNRVEGTYNTAVGYLADVSGDGLSNSTSIGNGAICTASNQITLGNIDVNALRCQVTTITGLSDRRDKKDVETLESSLEFIEQLKPVRFNWNMRDGGKVDIPEIGFIAQDLQQVQLDTGMKIPNLVYDVNPEKLEASYATLIPLLVKSIQELSQDNKRLNTTNLEMNAKIYELTAIIQDMKNNK